MSFTAERDEDDLVKRVMALRSDTSDALSDTEITAIVASVVDSMRGDFSSADLKLCHELEALVEYIQAAKAEISSLRPDKISSEHIPNATDELDAIVNATEVATNTIMAGAEVIEEVAAQLGGEQADKLVNAVTSIYEACSFQDITGQRIGKVVGTLQRIEGWVFDLVEAFGHEIERLADETPPNGQPAESQEDDSKLMNGPQLEGEGKSQAEIDALLASFD